MKNACCKTLALCGILAVKRRGILVKASGFQDGPKNPLKGIPMKSLVLASYAQFGVSAGG
jgi:hypothetical protein